MNGASLHASAGGDRGWTVAVIIGTSDRAWSDAERREFHRARPAEGPPRAEPPIQFFRRAAAAATAGRIGGRNEKRTEM